VESVTLISGTGREFSARLSLPVPALRGIPKRPSGMLLGPKKPRIGTFREQLRLPQGHAAYLHQCLGKLSGKQALARALRSPQKRRASKKHKRQGHGHGVVTHDDYSDVIGVGAGGESDLGQGFSGELP
jgi:hypothetical protein